jgi:vacuolar protein sorting-associated protein 35
MTVFDHLRHLTAYLYDGHISKKHHLSELYELVQYAAAIVPRLYLMVAVGSVYLRVSKEITQKSAASANDEGVVEIPVEIIGDDVPPIKDLMRDMMEMSRGVQHPTRGLFLRYFLSALTRDFLPDAKEDG